ncbi:MULTISPECIES: exodeoxyribonuclease VII small subunit [Methylobacterium]|uniref:Exodeoxyribonuclease 7 small subunit n=1 Tax=Methylobacterium thuringiense TaxID=1003091 RepID=A0ABQ4TM18_9HYPH|nr:MULTISPECIES: exodeoxyribonuclease VII small subunit [Methylobacterium]TXN20434.1 exodeoxyribonuclease VII small subunit [Methylobacterium sp. WL9]GJE55698.1 Exodeoxyribonuclease 7 small subunit [Methylobacterium thuringiense]
MNAARTAAPAPVPEAPDVVPEDLPFEAALAQLEEIVRQLEKGDVPLDRSVEIYERGEALKRHCESLLKRAEARIQRITLGSDGQAASVAPLDVE